MTIELTRDALMTDPQLVGIVNRHAHLIAVSLKLDTVEAKEVYRSMVAACIEVALALSAGN